ncbi:hypothetical protein [Tsukamurella paurometabola]|nr:hypothetical protein [Tsukamurella paurometabola]
MSDQPGNSEADSKPITGFVARIIDDFSLVINRGSKHGVRTGMKFEVLDTDWADIVDPETDEVIGSMPMVKATLKASDVYEKMAVLETFGRVTVGGMTPLGEAFGPRVERRERLKFSGKSLAEETKSILVGDEVEQVIVGSR